MTGKYIELFSSHFYLFPCST